MTNRLYYDDPYLRAFDAAVTSVDREGDRFVVTLDRTAFYPTSGGQPFDTGTLGGLRVVDVIARDDGTIVHVLDDDTALRTENVEPRTKNVEPRTKSLEPGAAVRCEIDWPRRFDHMQQHTGQHVLSAAFEGLFQVRTVSFHSGAEVSTIDLARAVSDRELAAAEDEANRVVWEDRAVTIRFATADEAARLPLRKEPKRDGTLRLIDVADFDLSACGGTHVARTGAIGIIAISGWERLKGGYRLEFVCGGRALSRFRSWRDTVTAATRLLSIGSSELPSAIERLQADAKDQKRAMTALQVDLARYRADELAATATDGVVVEAVDADANTLKVLATSVAAKAGLVVALVTRQQPVLAVVARSSNVRADAQKILASLVAKFGGRGGGKAELAQGGGLNGSTEDILAFARQLCSGTDRN